MCKHFPTHVFPEWVFVCLNKFFENGKYATCFTCPRRARSSATKKRPTSTAKSTTNDLHIPNFDGDGPSRTKYRCTVWNSARPHPTIQGKGNQFGCLGRFTFPGNRPSRSFKRIPIVTSVLRRSATCERGPTFVNIHIWLSGHQYEVSLICPDAVL